MDGASATKPGAEAGSPINCAIELGKWMLDISKYIITAYVLVRMFGKEDDSVWTLVSAILLAALLFGMGLYFVKRGKENLKKKGK